MPTTPYGSDDPTAAQPTRTAHPAHPAHSPARIGPYEIFQLLGEGGMGRVFLARSPGSRLVALKVIRPEYAEAPDFRGRFRREAASARRVSGFFTPPVLDADADAPQPWLATAYVPAPSLHEVVRAYGALPEAGLRALGTGLAEALLAIHGAGIVHRDLKPGNVLIAEDGPRVIDFGISSAVDATQVTRTGAVVGTPGFMAPEQIMSSREAGPAADLFSLGCVLVFAATRQGPFGTGGTADILYRAVHHPPQLAGVPEALQPLVGACLEKDPARRPPAASVLAALGAADPAALLTEGLREDLARREAHAAVLVAAPPVPMVSLAPPVDPFATPAPRGPSRRRFLWIAAAGTTVAAGGGAAALAGWRSEPDAAPARSGGSGSSGAGTTGRPEPKVPAGPKPRWSTPLKKLEGAKLHLLGDVLVHWEKGRAIAYDPETGKERWTGSLRTPSDVSGNPEWLGVQGSTLFATAWSGERGYLFGVDAAGKRKFTHVVTEQSADGQSAAFVQDVLSVAGSVALVGTSGSSAYGVLAVDLGSGKVLWSRKVNGSDFQAYADGSLCFLQDNGTLLGLGLRSGAERWKVRDVIKPGAYPALSTDGETLLVSSTKVQAFRATDGEKLWTAVNETTTISPARVRGKRAYVYDGPGTVFALDMRSGKQVWHRASPVHLTTTGGADSQGPTVSASVVAIATFATGDVPGFVVLRASDGKPLWAHQPSRKTGGKSDWLLQISGDTLFAASETTLYAFRSDPS
ncbi:PQQ-binding-like beta-propeller repeat protein [Streptomyces sp. BG9H]|uniref:PQQ-binding-like beta-propeller repeat protein n=1 Tax=Streptomyces anatolicus TaxID=2675858 RepID=A0ABS6YVQ5_9ACTN|nr:PQQ-binding-like beta-propeller repeat protein [Streptomyces anatolicus]MBW5425458.1 PQQ-binding-like beta-propeller repeat protein [Streptomyces anatolicus]